jgi:hypothetical protein
MAARKTVYRGAPRCAAAVMVLALGSGFGLGCATEFGPPAIVSQAMLGRVIIYRNGVAYFERYAAASDDELTLRVPAERVDDFLKSLTIIDDQTGETMPVSYPTLDRAGGEVEMTIKLPERHNRLRISYVTESPAWKPSYRVVLGEGGKAQLQGWAVVDNVSGEDWKHVKIGVGSTSALSFRYDLHSVRLVERETLSTGSLLAVAPPTGGSPYADKGKKVRVMASIDQSTLAELGDDDESRSKVAQAERTKDVRRKGWRSQPAYKKTPPRGGTRTTGSGGTTLGGRGQGYGRGGLAGRAVGPQPTSGYGSPAKPAPVTSRPGHGSRSDQMLWTLTRQLQSSKQRVRIEGYAQTGDKDGRLASLDRANRLRNRLIEQGIAASQIEAVGTGEINDQQALRVLEVTEPQKETKKGNDPADAPVASEPLGQAHFVSADPITIESEHSAMISILNEETQGEKVYYYDPISTRGSKKFAFNAVRLTNPSKYTLDSGPFTVYVEGQFLGEGLAEPILPHSTAFIPYALDRTIIVEPEVTGRQEIDKLITIQRGIVSTETKQIRKTKLSLTNRGREVSKIYVRHQVAPGYTLQKSPTFKVEKLGGAHLFPLMVKAGETLELDIEEWTPIETSVDIRTDQGIKAIGLYLRKAKIDRKLQEALREIIGRHTSSADMEQRIELLGEQMAVYRTRVDEINVQLVTLRKVPQAARLRQHLSKKMEEISNKLQDATMELTDLKGQLMTLQIELQDKLAELSLVKRDEPKKGPAPKK